MANEPEAPANNTTPFEKVQWDLVPDHTAVVVIDAQNDFLHEKGWYKDDGPFMRLRPFLKDGGLRQNTWGYELPDELTAGEKDWFVEKIV